MSVLQHACPSCSHEMSFLPAGSKVVCGSCGYEEVIYSDAYTDAPLAEHAYADVDGRNELVYKTVAVDCDKCGAPFQLPDFTISMDCPYCGANTVVDFSKREHSVKPSGIVPFKVTKEQLMETVVKQVKGNPFVSRKVVRHIMKEGVHGIYLPAYSFDFVIVTDYVGERGDDYHVDGANGKRETRTSWKRVRGTVITTINDLQFVNSQYGGLLKLNEQQNAKLVAFDEKYVSGFLAEGHSIPLSESFAKVSKFPADTVAAAIRRDIGGDRQRITDDTSQYRDIRYRHFLYPFWVGNYTYKGKNRVFMASGEDGSVQIQVPIRKRRVLAYFTLVGILYLFLATQVASRGWFEVDKAGFWFTVFSGLYWIISAVVVSQYGVGAKANVRGKQALAALDKADFQRLAEVKNIAKKSVAAAEGAGAQV